MFKKFAATTLAVTMIATTAMSVSTQAASAKNGRNGALIAGAIIGLAAGAIVASQARQAHGQGYGQGYGAPRLQNNRSNGYTYNNRYAAPSLNTSHGYTAPRRCHNEPIRQWNPYRGHTVIVGYERVCF